MGLFSRTKAPPTGAVAADAALSAGPRTDAAAAQEADALSSAASDAPVDADTEKQLKQAGKWETDEKGNLVRVTSKETGEGQIDLKVSGGRGHVDVASDAWHADNELAKDCRPPLRRVCLPGHYLVSAAKAV
jgi:hypothetical protein